MEQVGLLFWVTGCESQWGTRRTRSRRSRRFWSFCVTGSEVDEARGLTPLSSVINPDPGRNPGEGETTANFFLSSKVRGFETRAFKRRGPGVHCDVCSPDRIELRQSARMGSLDENMYNFIGLMQSITNPRALRWSICISQPTNYAMHMGHARVGCTRALAKCSCPHQEVGKGKGNPQRRRGQHAYLLIGTCSAPSAAVPTSRTTTRRICNKV